MRARREDLSKPAWTGDQLDAAIPPETEAPYFDRILGAWVLSRYADILAAFHSAGLAPAGPHSNPSASSGEPSPSNMRAETLEALSPPQLQLWRERWMPHVDALTARLPLDQPVDVLSDYARPLCLILAAIVTGIDLEEAQTLDRTARQVSDSAAEPYDPALRVCAKSASAALRPRFQAGPEPLRDSGFVALSQTLPSLLGNAWFALLEQPPQWVLLHRQPALMEQALEELLRYACLVRILFRMATDDIDLNGFLIQKGERVILRIAAANRDPARFPNSHQVDILHRGSGHLTLGAGAHSCVGASLIRMAAIGITHPLLKRFASAILTQPVEWHGGSGFRTPVALWVNFRLHS